MYSNDAHVFNRTHLPWGNGICPRGWGYVCRNCLGLSKKFHPGGSPTGFLSMVGLTEPDSQQKTAITDKHADRITDRQHRWNA